MMDSNERMVRQQALLISNLNREITNLKQEYNHLVDHLAKTDAAAAMYNHIQELVKRNPNIADNWSDFLMMLKMVEPDVEKEFKELTIRTYRKFEIEEEKKLP